MEVLCLLCLQVGAEENEFYEQFHQILVKLVTGSQIEELRVSAIATLAFASFVCSSNSNEKIMTFCEDVICGESEGTAPHAALKARAALSWCLLATVSAEAGLLDRSRDRLFSAVAELLDETDTDVKIAAGLTLAMLWEVAEETHPGLDHMGSGALLCDDPAEVAQAVAVLQQAARESSKRISKKDKKEQVGSVFSEYHWLQPPTATFKFIFSFFKRDPKVNECTFLRAFPFCPL
jgi:hypothetical protein